MYTIAILIYLCFGSVLSSTDNEVASVKLQEAVLRLQLAAQAAKLKTDFGTRQSTLQEVGMTIVSHSTIANTIDGNNVFECNRRN